MIGGFTNAVLLQAGSGHRVRGNHFGKFSDDVLGGSDNHNAIYVNNTADNVDIGGLDPAERNSIAGHPDPVAPQVTGLLQRDVHGGIVHSMYNLWQFFVLSSCRYPPYFQE